MASSRDVQEVVSKLSSDKAKTREEGIKLLSTWLEGERSVGFCKLLGHNTARLKADEIPHAETWPFLVTLLVKCVSLEISTSKRRPPKLVFAKTLRTAIQRAEDGKLSGDGLLLPVVKLLFNHIWDVVRDAATFQSEYSVVLRLLLSVKEYRYQMRKRVYCSFVLLYLNKAGMAVAGKDKIQSSTREEVFRYILTLHMLLENPPGDFPDNLRRDIVQGFVEIFSQIREEGKIPRKLLECVNTYLLKDGPNLGQEAMDIHSSLQEFVFRCWLTTHDRGLKNSLILYAKLQLKLSRSSEGSLLIEQLLDVIDKEFDQSHVASAGIPKSDAARDDKVGTLGNSQQGLMELTASVYYQVCLRKLKAPNGGKRLRRENPENCLKEGLMKGKWLWCGSFYFLIHNYGFRISISLLVDWFEGISSSFERILNDSNSVHYYDGLSWLLRCLDELSSVLPSINLQEPMSHSDKVRGGWHVIWNSLMHGLPIFSNVTQVADAVLMLLGSMIAKEIIDLPIVPRDIWELQIFKHMPSSSALYFMACYFSRRGVQSDLIDALHLRRNLLRAALGLINLKETIDLNERISILLPAAISSLCSGCCPFTFEELANYCNKTEENDQDSAPENSDYSVEVLAKIRTGTSIKVLQTDLGNSIRLPREMRQLLIDEFEEHLLHNVIGYKEMGKFDLPQLLFISSFLCNCVYCANLAWPGKERTIFFSQMLGHISRLLDNIVSVVEERHKELQCHGCSSFSSIFDATGSTFASLRSVAHSPFLCFFRDRTNNNDELILSIIKSLEKFLRTLAALYTDFSKMTSNMDIVTSQLSSSVIPAQSSYPTSDGIIRIVDLELDADDGSNDADCLAVSESSFLALSLSSVQWKLSMISAVSLFFSILPTITWEVMFDVFGKESDAEVRENILSTLCKSYSCRAWNLVELVNSIKNMMDGSPVCCAHLLTSTSDLLENLVSSSGRTDDNAKQMKEMVSEQNLQLLAEMVIQVAEIGLADWFARVKLIDCIFCFILLNPCVGQAVIGTLLAMLQDTDFRVRLFLARRIGVLFQTWDGHDELFQDICSNLGLPLVMASREKLVKAQEVLASSYSGPTMETTIITLAHVAMYSERLELEVIFMICAVAAMDPHQRVLICSILDNLSSELRYSSKTKYLEELMGSILYCWVACEVSLTSLVEIRDLFIVRADANQFMILCCPWLIPTLIINQDKENLHLVSKITGKSLSFLAKEYFVQIFSFCIALHSSENPYKEMGEQVLRGSLLHIAEISELERDNLIKRHMVSIVSCLLSLSSSSSLPAMLFFTRETVEFSIWTVVDGFLEMDDRSSSDALVDKLNIFRPDRVFKFLLEIHYQITTAVHPRHRCHRLSAVEVLLKVIGNRAAVPSTSYYVLNLVGQFIGNHALQDQCCVILSTLLAAFTNSLTNNAAIVLGKQLQLIVSKLIDCHLPSTNNEQTNTVPSCKVLPLLHQLTVDADPSLHNFIRELEPFPELDCFARIRQFHDELCQPDTPRDHFLKFVKRACQLSPKLHAWSLQALHRKLLMPSVFQPERNVADICLDLNSWDFDPQQVSAVWNLVGICDLDEVNDISELVADFISRVGIGDPYRVVFRLPGVSIQKPNIQLGRDSNPNESVVPHPFGISEEDLIVLIRLLKKYLLDDCVKTVDLTSRALQGILSTERGQIALQHLDYYERSIIAIHSKGINNELVENLLEDSKERCGVNLNDSSAWTTYAKTYKMWICPLVHLLISFCNDIVLRLCHDIVLLKDEVAEFLFPVLLLNLAGMRDANVDICHLISEKVQEYIFVEPNNLMKSIRVFLDALNSLRSYHVTEKAAAPSAMVKHGRTSSSTRTRYIADKAKEPLWEKVYWLNIDYLLVAKAAFRCGSFFTAVMYVEHWCEEHYNGLTLGSPDFSNLEVLPPHIELLVAAVNQINEPDSIYGIIQTHKLTSQIITYEHEENWTKALEYYDLLVRTSTVQQSDGSPGITFSDYSKGVPPVSSSIESKEKEKWRSHKGLMRSLQQMGCTHVLDVYCQGLTGQKGHVQDDPEFTELQYEAAWRAGNWDFSVIPFRTKPSHHGECYEKAHFNENLHSCLRAFQEGDLKEFHLKLKESKKELLHSISNASHESTGYIHSTIVKIQILYHLGLAWDLRWRSYPHQNVKSSPLFNKSFQEPSFPSMIQMERLNADRSLVRKQMQLNLNLLEPFIAFRSVLLQILNCKESRIEHLLQSASALRKGGRFPLAVEALHEFKLLCGETEEQGTSYLCSLGRLEEARVLWAQGQHELAINLAKYILKSYQLKGEASNVYRLVGKWLAETRSSNSRIVLEQYLKRSVELTEVNKSLDKKYISRQCQTYFNLAHYTDALFKSYEERLASSEWQAAMRLKKHKTKELDALIRQLKGSTKGEKTDYSVKIQELQKQLAMDREEAEKVQEDRDNFLSLALEGYQRCLVIGGKYDIRVVFQLVSLWFTLSSRQIIIASMLSTIKEVQSYKFIPLVYQIASRMGSSKDGHAALNFQTALTSLVKKMAIDHPYHTIYQILALANGDRVKDKQRSRNSFIVDMDKKLAAENLLNELSSYHGAIIRQLKQMVEIYIKLAELETKKEETNKRMPLPREIRSLRQLELVPVVTATFPVDPNCQYSDGSFPHFKGLGDSVTIMNGINAPKVVDCVGSDGHKYRQLAKSGNDDLRQDAVMEQFFGLVNTFLQNHRDTWKRKIRIRTYKVVPFTPSAGVLEWVDGTVPLGEYLLGSARNGGAHARYGIGDWSFLQCREHMASEKDKRKAFQKTCQNFRPVMHYFFLERFLQPSDWFEKRLSYTRSVAASSMVGYIVGLGDRHSMNILIDQATAEVVHIDLGVAFEQGLMLKTPERVPFRLTRDVIDGMGITGVEGVFRRCCEETLSVMRANKEALLTIIEVFIHDPLYKWALSPLKALQRQKEIDDDSESNLEDSQDACEGNKDAARALLRVKQKLNGYEEGELRSVQGQVQQLIQDAIDVERLCQMFPGWGAWL